MPASAPVPPPHAVVVGAGLGGLAAARVLGRHIERVTLVERDDLPGPAALGTPPTRPGHGLALRRVLDAPRVVVRSGLEAVGLVVDAGRIQGVVVRSRRGGGVEPTSVIRADLVVDASGAPSPLALVAPPDGLVVVALARGAGAEGGHARCAGRTAVALGRCLAEHLRAGSDLAGFSATAQRAVTRAAAGDSMGC